MTAAEFKSWQASAGFNDAQAAAALGVTTWSILAYKRPPGGKSARVIPKTVALLCDRLVAENQA